MRKENPTKTVVTKKPIDNNIPTGVTETENLEPKNFFTEAQTIRVEKPPTPEYIYVNRADLKKIRRNILRLKKFSNGYQNAFWASVGFIISAVFGLVSIYQSEKPSLNILVTGWILLTASFVSLVICGLATYKEKKDKHDSLDAIEEDLETINPDDEKEKPLNSSSDVTGDDVSG